jgi:hypothetical protein
MNDIQDQGDGWWQSKNGSYFVHGEQGWMPAVQHWFPFVHQQRSGRLTFEKRFTLRLGYRSELGIWDWKHGIWVVYPVGNRSEEITKCLLSGMKLCWKLK